LRNTLLIAGVVIAIAIIIGLVVSMGVGIISLPWRLLSVLAGSGQSGQPTITWFTPTPTARPTTTPSPTPYPTLAPTPTPTPVPPTLTPTPTVYVIFYAVQPGETLADIAAKFGVTVEDILKANRLPPNSTVFPGQLLAIPAPQTTPTPAPTWTPTSIITTTVTM